MNWQKTVSQRQLHLPVTGWQPADHAAAFRPDPGAAALIAMGQGGQGTAMMAEWTKLQARNTAAKLVCIDIQPYGTTQVKGRADILNVGGFSDAVFDVIARFAKGETRDWVSIINAVEL